MDILFLLIPLSIVLIGVVVWALLWAIRSGQFEDMRGPAERIIMDDDAPRRAGKGDSTPTHEPGRGGSPPPEA